MTPRSRSSARSASCPTEMRDCLMEEEHARMTRGPNGRAGRWLVRGLAACGLMALGALGSMVRQRGAGTFSPPFSIPAVAPRVAEVRPTAELATAEAAPDAEVEVMLAPEALMQAGIKMAEVRVVEPRASTEVPGVV